MKQLVLILTAASLLATAAPVLADSVPVSTGKMLYASNGQRIASIYRVTSDGNPQIVLNGKLVTVPASTLSSVDGKVTTSLTKADLGKAQ